MALKNKRARPFGRLLNYGISNPAILAARFHRGDETGTKEMQDRCRGTKLSGWDDTRSAK